MAQDNSGKELPKGIRQRKDGRYEGRFTYQGESFTFYNKNLKELVKEMQDKKYEVEHGLYAKRQKITVDSWFHTWMEEYKKNSVKYGTYKTYMEEYELHIQKQLGKKRLADIRSEHVQRLLNGMTDKYSRSTISLVKIILNSMFKQACKNRLILSNPVENTTMPKEKKMKKIRVFTVEEQKLFLKYAEDSIYYALYIVGLGTGMRSGELRALLWDDIDFEKKRIFVNGTLKYIAKGGEEKYRIDTPKTESSRREIPMLDNVYLILKRHKTEQMKQKILLGELWKPQAGFESLVFTGAFGRCITDTALYENMKKIVAKIRNAGHEFENATPHTLRHTFATRGLENGIPPKVMQELLGHTSITMTLDIYSHVLPDTKAEEMKKLANVF